MVRYEFGSSSCSRLALCLSWMLAETIRPSFAQAASAAAALQTRPAWDRSRDIAPDGASWRAACVVTLCFRLTMFRWRIFSAAIATRAARKFCPDAMTSEPFAPAPLPFPFPCFSFSSIDAPRGAVGWRTCRSPFIFARGERVSHGKQNDHRRFPPGGNQGGGSTRKSRRGV